MALMRRKPLSMFVSDLNSIVFRHFMFLVFITSAQPTADVAEQRARASGGESSALDGAAVDVTAVVAGSSGLHYPVRHGRDGEVADYTDEHEHYVHAVGVVD